VFIELLDINKSLWLQDFNSDCHNLLSVVFKTSVCLSMVVMYMASKTAYNLEENVFFTGLVADLLQTGTLVSSQTAIVDDIRVQSRSAHTWAIPPAFNAAIATV